MKQLAAFGFIILIVVLPSCRWLREKGLIGRKADTMAVWQVKQDSIRVADSIRNVQNRLLALENARLDSLKKVEQAKLDWESKFRYNIILGSFITPEYARKYSSDLSQKGYKTRILKLEGTKFEMVSAEAHDNFTTALRRLKQFQDTVATDAWMYIIKKK
jgi:hypothetical protein